MNTLTLPAPVTPAEFAALCVLNRDLRLELTAQGELVIMAPAGSDGSRRNLLLILRLGVWSEQDGTGIAFESSAGFTLPNGAVRSPDASWVRRERWSVLSQEQQRQFAPLCPDFVVELRSPTDSLRELQRKMREYQGNGTRLGWLLDPQHQSVEIYRPNQEVEILTAPALLTGEEVLPGFTLDPTAILAN
ncbi:Uma2 family endonuclease [Candidatus Cyanaurora vandensis]|uniref:Uma2 family endonuclease n=1 Tax=Candidatus Cyanaurora vandensis TaxID=2714958 RepID=UPI00257A3D4F|nr:Uma2 family endonuclease [Candidatus Cyanaurora vandensis]